MIRQPDLKVHTEENDIMDSIQAGKIYSIYFSHDQNHILFMVTGSNQHHSVVIAVMALQASARM